jgi:hypothetical protein
MAWVAKHAWTLAASAGVVASIIALALNQGTAAVVVLIAVPLLVRLVIWAAARNALPRAPRGPL